MRHATKCLLIAIAISFCLRLECALSQEPELTFRQLLEAAEIDADSFSAFAKRAEGSSAEWNAEDWQLILQLLFRINQHSPTQLAGMATKWAVESPSQVGDLVSATGTVVAVEEIRVSDSIAKTQGLESIYRCHFWLKDSGNDKKRKAVVLTSKIPTRWKVGGELAEPIGFQAILLRDTSDGDSVEPLFLASNLAWYPQEGVPTGHLLLARHGMDVGLLEEIKQRQPFVDSKVSREGEAFYGCLAALNRVNAAELKEASSTAVAQFANHWRESDSADQQQRAIASRVIQRSELGLSSAAPMFLLPEQMTGRLVRIEGIARRAVRIAVNDQSGIESYYEVEIFPPDSQNQPIVLCTNNLPADFPSGDAIREPVRMTGIFFKSWRYRSREVQEIEGETDRQQQMYTPVVVGAVDWLPQTSTSTNRWGLWGGIVFLVLLVLGVINALYRARSDRRALSARREKERVELPRS